MPSNCQTAILSEDFADFILPYEGIRQRILELYPDNCLLFPSPDYFLLYEPITDRRLSPEQAFSYFTIPKLYAPVDSTSMDSSGITQNQANPLLNLKGRGILIGFLDSGIDWTNPVFLGEDGNTRILRIWDQSLTPAEDSTFSSPSIAPFGTEFSKQDIDAALRGETPPLATMDETGHGTFAAGIAAGKQIPTSAFTGAAPEAWIAMVKLKQAKSYLRTFFRVPETAEAYQENDLILAALYLVEVARQERLPLVLCITTGTSSGSHDGTSPFGQILDRIAVQVGYSVVVAAGNEAGEGHHYFGKLDQSSPMENVDLRVGANEEGFTLELWANQPEEYSIGFTTPSGESLPDTIFYSQEEKRLTFRLDPTEIYVSYHPTEVGTGSQLILMRFFHPTRGIWRLHVHNMLFLEGTYHMWLPVAGFLEEDTVFLRPDPDVTITEPGNAIFPITVSTYNHQNNSIYIHSSRGYTRSGRIKPDIAAPGVDVFGPALTPTPRPSGRAILDEADLNTLQNTGIPRFTRRTGSCVAAAHAAGAAADLLEWGILRRNRAGMNTTIVKSLFIRGANRNPVYSYPNREFGYGTLDLYKSVSL